jgi:predicted nucleic acid-binding protein
MKYVDANVFIYPVIYDENRIVEANVSKSILLKIVNGEIKACTSYLTWDEIVYVISRVSGQDNGKQAGSNFLLFPNLRILGVDEEIIKYAQGLIEKYDLNPRDAIHAASAIQNGVSEIITNDNDFDAVNELKRLRLEEV